MLKLKVTLDRQAMKNGVDRISAKGIGYAAGYVRKTARNNLRRKPGKSVAPNPPHVHSNETDATLTNIAYAVSPNKRGAVVGVVRATQVPLVNGKTVPQLIHDGGVAKRWQIRPKGSRSSRWLFWNGRGLPDARKFDRRSVQVRYRPRPFMLQALQKAVQANEIVKQFARGGR
jgi:hypothetical protein